MGALAVVARAAAAHRHRLTLVRTATPVRRHRPIAAVIAALRMLVVVAQAAAAHRQQLALMRTATAACCQTPESNVHETAQATQAAAADRQRLALVRLAAAATDAATGGRLLL